MTKHNFMSRHRVRVRVRVGVRARVRVRFEAYLHVEVMDARAVAHAAHLGGRGRG